MLCVLVLHTVFVASAPCFFLSWCCCYCILLVIDVTLFFFFWFSCLRWYIFLLLSCGYFLYYWHDVSWHCHCWSSWWLVLCCVVFVAGLNMYLISLFRVLDGLFFLSWLCLKVGVGGVVCWPSLSIFLVWFVSHLDYLVSISFFVPHWQKHLLFSSVVLQSCHLYYNPKLIKFYRLA